MMKKTIILLGIAGMCYSGMAATNPAPAINSPIIKSVSDYVKSSDGTWEGKDKVWYKLDKKAQLWWSKDGKKWDASKDQTWQDKDGKWLKINNKKLVWSADGKKWDDVPEWAWESPNGKWYKFDKDWSLWVKE